MVSKSSATKARRIRQQRQAAARRAKIGKLFLRGMTKPGQLRDATGVSIATISRDLEMLRKEWGESAKKDFDAYIGMILRKIDDQEEQIWSWFDDTRKDAVEIKKETMDAEKGHDGHDITITGRTTETRKGQAGSGQAFALLQNLNKQRLDIVEMIAKAKGGREVINATQINLTTISDDLLKRLKTETDAALGLNQKRLHAPKPAKEKSAEKADEEPIDAEFTPLAGEPAPEISGGSGQGDAGTGGDEGEIDRDAESGSDEAEASGGGFGDGDDDDGIDDGEPGEDLGEGTEADEDDEE